MPDEELHRKFMARPGAAGSSSADPLAQILQLVKGGSSQRCCQTLQHEAMEAAHSLLLSAAQAYDVAARSLAFFDKTLAATRGEASAEHRSCSICLDDDIPSEELSITLCAHVFHTGCIAEVLAKFGTCPECRHRLDPAKDITQLVAEIAIADKAKTAGEPAAAKRRRNLPVVNNGKTAEVARQFGSKLAAIVSRLQDIERKGEKAIVFCQWEDLKRKVASALSACQVRHFELAGNIYQRGEVIRRFQEDRGETAICVLLLSLEQSASGTNLTAANHIVFVHPMSAASPEKAVSYEAQAIGRCRRWGQQRSEVHCWRFVTRGTVEETITTRHCSDLWQNHLREVPALARVP